MTRPPASRPASAPASSCCSPTSTACATRTGASSTRLTVAEADHLIDTGVIAGGMVPKIRAALSALGWEGAEAIIADSGAESALERALSDPTFGTRITATRQAVGAA